MYLDNRIGQKKNKGKNLSKTFWNDTVSLAKSLIIVYLITHPEDEDEDEDADEDCNSTVHPFSDITHSVDEIGQWHLYFRSSISWSCFFQDMGTSLYLW